MKSRDTLIRLKKFQVDEKRRRVNQIEGMIADFQRMSVDLEREIQTEQDRAGIQDPTHFAYPTYAKAAIQRRENLTRSASRRSSCSTSAIRHVSVLKKVHASRLTSTASV
jgi:flagellar protein FliJ